MNTREYRYRKRLEDERHKLIEKAMKIIPNYHPPSDYRRPTKTQEKVYVPVNDYPEINFSMITNPLTPNHFLSLLLVSFFVYCFDSRLSSLDFFFPFSTYLPHNIYLLLHTNTPRRIIEKPTNTNT